MADQLLTTIDLPLSLWNPDPDAGIKTPRGVMALPEQLSDTYREALNELGLLKQAQNLQNRVPGRIGGANDEESRSHFAENFSGSCGRTQLFAIDPHLAFKTTRDALVSLFSGGYLTILDIPSGAGSGSATLLALVTELRKQGVLPKVDLDVRIVGGDISPTSRSIAEKIFEKMKEQWILHGISVSHKFMDWNVLSDESTGDLIEAWEETFDQRDGLLLGNNFSGYLGTPILQGKPKLYVDEAESPLRQIMTTVARNRFTTFWLEPSDKPAGKLMPKLDTIIRKYSRIRPAFIGHPNSSAAIQDPINSGRHFAVRSTGIHLEPTP